MNARLPRPVKSLACLLGLALALFPVSARAQAGAIPARPLAEKGALIFADDFSTNRFGGVWMERIKSAGVENGVMFGRQTTTEHGSVASAKLALPDGNLICECRVQFERNVTVAFSFDDMSHKGSVAGHIARVTLEPQLVKLHDDKEGAMNRKLTALKKTDDAAAKAGAEEEIKRHTLPVPMKLETSKWHAFGVEIVGDQMRVTLDGAPVGFLKSAGLAHVPKPDLKISVSGKQALFDDLRIWSVKK
ncbi:MAG: hypothetical protein HY301_16765 [Verrucomicrobia bacterium]|nr:hypothetical protein [Verrucomicrobiota bacterium]